MDVTFRPLGPFKKISNVMFSGLTDHGHLRVFFPTKDRRKARRVARRLKMKFRRGSDGYIVWKKTTT